MKNNVVRPETEKYKSPRDRNINKYNLQVGRMNLIIAHLARYRILRRPK